MADKPVIAVLYLTPGCVWKDLKVTAERCQTRTLVWLSRTLAIWQYILSWTPVLSTYFVKAKKYPSAQLMIFNSKAETTLTYIKYVS